MIYDKTIKGNFINIRSVQENDSEFILSLRLDSKLNKYLNKVENDIEKQRKWILNQQNRKDDYYFLITDKNNNPIGTISLYNVENKQGEFGRWILKGNSLQSIESVLLLHEFGFNNLSLNLIYSNTVIENKKIISFHKNFGATITNETNIHPIGNFILQKAIIKKFDFINIKYKNNNILKRFI